LSDHNRLKTVITSDRNAPQNCSTSRLRWRAWRAANRFERLKGNGFSRETGERCGVLMTMAVVQIGRQ
jgi:hypothetical protein